MNELFIFEFKKGINVSFGSVKAPRFGLIGRLLQDGDTSDLYEGGRSSGKRKHSDDDYDDNDSRRSNDPNAFDSSAAKCRKSLIDAEFNKRKSVTISNSGPSEEDKLLAEKTLLNDPFSYKIQNLTLYLFFTSFIK